MRIVSLVPSVTETLLAFGVTLSLVLQGVVNAGVVLGCLPTKGLALPFLSYGGSAMIVALAQIGVLLALGGAFFVLNGLGMVLTDFYLALALFHLGVGVTAVLCGRRARWLGAAALGLALLLGALT